MMRIPKHYLLVGMKKIALAVAAAALVSGCATTQNIPMDPAAGMALKGQSVAVTARAEKPSFSAMTAGKAAFALIGAALMIKEGNSIINDNEVPDPAVAIREALAKHLAETRDMRVAPALNVNTEDAQQLAVAANGSAKYVLDVQTVGWMFGYFPTDWTHYRVMHTAQARLIDADSKKVIAAGSCARIPETNANAPTYDELINNKAAGLKKELAIATEECIANLKKSMLAI